MRRRSTLALLVLAATVVTGVAAGAPPTDIGKAGAVKFSISGDWLAGGSGTMWLSDPPAKVVREIAPSTGKETAIAVRQEPCASPDFAFGALWTETCNPFGLARIDPRSRKVTGFVRLPVWAAFDGEGSIAAGYGGVWVVINGPGCENCRLARIDPRTMRIVAKIRIVERATSVRVGYGSVWVVSPYTAAGTVQKVSPASNKVVATAKIGRGPRFFDVGEGGVWTLNQDDGTVSRIDPRTGKLAATIQARVRGTGGDMAVGGGWVWARGYDVFLTRIDPRSHKVVQVYGPPVGSGSVAVGPGGVWISAHDVRSVWRLRVPRR